MPEKVAKSKYPSLFRAIFFTCNTWEKKDKKKGKGKKKERERKEKGIIVRTHAMCLHHARVVRAVPELPLADLLLQALYPGRLGRRCEHMSDANLLELRLDLAAILFIKLAC